MEKKKYIEEGIFLTKESFNEHLKKLIEKNASNYGMTPEQWKLAVASGSVVTQPYGSEFMKF
jgi:hypothetical protein